MRNSIQLSVDSTTQNVSANHPNPTPSVLWDQTVQAAVRNTAPGPTIASRAYGILHTAMYDAWAAYDASAIATTDLNIQRPAAEKNTANLTEAMSFAAYRVLSDLFPTQQALFDQQMNNLGFDIENNTLETTTAAGIGNASAKALLDIRHGDGSNQLNGYVPTTEYVPINPDGNSVTQLDRWTPELLGDPDNPTPQNFLTPQWGSVTPFSLNDESIEAFRPVAPEPFLLVEGATVNLENDTITLQNGDIVAISRDLIGTLINPAFIEQSEEVVEISANLTDEQKLIAEFWEDAGGTAFPPGTWMTFGQVVSARDAHSIDEDAVLFLGLANAAFDAGIAAWESKTYYDYARPVRVIRELGTMGLLNDGRTGIDEVTGETGFVIEAWGGPGEGTKTILAKNFITYQTPNSDPSPPFAEYVSGHSTFSGAGAAVLSAFTNSDEFGAAVTFPTGSSRFEPGLVPNDTLTLTWDTFTEAADEGGISRLYGGIHFEDGDVNGRQLGRDVGRTVWEEVQRFADAYAPEVSISNAKLEVGDGANTSARLQTIFKFSKATDDEGVALLVSFDNGTAALQTDFSLSLEESENITDIELLADGHRALISIAGGVSEASLAIAPNASINPAKTIEARLVDALGYRLAADADLSVAPVLDGFTTTAPGIFSVKDDFTMRLSVDSPAENHLAGEVVLFSVDNAQGTINGSSADSADYLSEILSSLNTASSDELRAKPTPRVRTALSVLASKDAEAFSEDTGITGFSRTFALDQGTQFGFMLVQDGTVDELRRDPNSRQVLFSTQSSTQSSLSADGLLNLTFEDSATRSIGSLAVNLRPVQPQIAEQRYNLTGVAQTESEVIDLRKSTAETLTAKVNVYSEAAYDNLVGFYRTNEAGDVLDQQGRLVATVGSEAYRRAVIDNRIAANVSDEGSYDLTFAGGSMFGTFLIADGSLDSFDLNNVYVSSIGNNADEQDHIRMLGDNVFGFEDRAGGGDRDFNDMIVSIEFV